MVKLAKIGVYESKTRKLQKKLSYENVSLTWKTANLYKYLGSRASDAPNVYDIQVTTFMETPDRAYAEEAIPINIHFEPLPEQVVDYSQFGVIDPIGGEQIIRIHVNSYEDIGRTVIEGDVLEVPFFRQGEKKAYWEVVDVDGSQEFEKFYAVLKLNVLDDKRETREIDKNNSIGPSLDDIMDQQEQTAEDYVPHSGVDDSVIDNGETNNDMNKEYNGQQKNRRSFLDDFDGGLL